MGKEGRMWKRRGKNKRGGRIEETRVGARKKIRGRRKEARKRYRK